jgi:hypothetical protein
MVEVPPGGVNTQAASALMNSVEHMGSIDSLFIAVNATAAPFKSYITQFQTISAQFDRGVLSDTRLIDQSTADSSITPAPSGSGSAFSVWVEGGVAYLAGIGTTAATNRVYAVPLGADWEYAGSTDCCVVTPRIACENIDKFVREYTAMAEIIGGDSGKNLGHSPEAIRVKYRTTGISDNSGAWTLLDDTGSLSGVAGADYIQFRIEFRTIGVIGVMPRVHAIAVLFEDLATLSNYQPSVGLSDVANSRFAWRFATGFGSAVPALRVRLYDAQTGGLLVDDNTASPTGTFQRSTDTGVAWSAWNNTDKGNENTYVLYTPASLGSGIKVRALLTLN